MTTTRRTGAPRRARTARGRAAVAPLFSRILVPHDFSVHATRAVEVAADLAVRTGGRLHVLHVVTPFYGGPGFPSPEVIAWTPTEELVADLRRRLERLVAAVVPAKLRARVRCEVTIGEPLPRILAAARTADAIVMATIGRTGLSHLLIGSVAENVVRKAPCPVFTVRHPEHEFVTP